MLATVANSSTQNAAGPPLEALSEGFQDAFLAGAGIAILGLIATLVLIRSSDSRAHVELGGAEAGAEA